MRKTAEMPILTVHTMRLTRYTVFAQVIDGMDVVDKIASAKVRGRHPRKNIVIKSIKITQYKEESTTQADSTSAKSVTQPTTVG